MTRLDILLAAYQHYDTICTALILVAAWVAVTGQMLDWMLVRKWRAIILIFWSLVITGYLAGIIFVGLKFS
jgi:hypothetical protein